MHATRLDAGQFRRRPGLTVHERSNGLQAVDGVIDMGSAIMGTGRCNGQMAALVAADAALHRHLLTVDDLASSADHVVGPGSVLCRRVVELADGRAESPGETRLREELRWMGLVAIPQFRIEDGPFLALVGFFVEEYQLADPDIEYARSQIGFAMRKYQDTQLQIDSARIKLDTAQAAFQHRYRVVTPAEAPNKPTKPQPVKVILGALVSGLMLGLFIALALEIRRDLIYEPWQVETSLGLPVVAHIDLGSKSHGFQ